MRKKVGKILSMFLCMAMVAIVFSVVPVNVSADEFVLHPGYITGTITGPYEILTGGTVYATGTDPVSGNTYTAQTSINTQTGEYTLIVEGGNWEYRLNCEIKIPNGQINLGYKYSTVGVGETVQVDFQTNAVIQGTVEIKGETIGHAWIRIGKISGIDPLGYYGYIFLTGQTTSYSYSIPVIGGNADYRIECRDLVITMYDRIYFGYQYENVDVGETAVVDFISIPGYIQGTATLSTGSIQGGYLTATGANGNWARTSSFNTDGSFSFPVIPALHTSVGGTIYTDMGTYILGVQYVDTVEGQTSIVNWQITVDTARISGDVNIVGVDFTSVNLKASGPFGSKRETTIYGNGPYLLDDLRIGNWRVNTKIYDSEYDSINGYLDNDLYYFPPHQVTLTSGQEHIKDFELAAGFLDGNILSESTAIDDLYYFKLSAQSIGQGSAQTICNDYGYNPNLANYYDMFVAPGDWKVTSIQLSFRDDHFPYNPYYTSNMLINEYTTQFVHVGSGETVEYDLNYENAEVTARFKVATGDPLSKPDIVGNYQYNSEGIYDRYVHIQASSTQSNVEEGLVKFYPLPGTYRLLARAHVLGSYTTFGQFYLTVEPGDVVIVDPDAPNVDIAFPPGNYETEEECVIVSGTVTDESEIASFTINGVEVSVGEDGSFQQQVCGLVLGDNVIEVTASDINDNEVIIDRTVIRIYPPNTPPSAELDVSYTGTEGTAVVFDAGGSTDEEGDELQYRWDFDNDDTWDTEYSIDPTASYTWDDEYSGTVKVEVFDGEFTDSTTTSITVDNSAPVVASFPLFSAGEGSDITYTFSFSDAGISDTHTVVIDWGDGDLDYPVVSESGDSGTFVGTHAYSDDDSYTGTVTVTDNDGDSHSLTLVVDVENLPPSVSIIALPNEIDEGALVDFTGGIFDPGLADTHTFEWNFDDGSTADDSLDQTHGFYDEGTYYVSLSVTDDDGDTGSASIPIKVNNVAPTAFLGNKGPQDEGSEVTVSFSDQYDPGTSDTFTYSFDWDNDGTYDIVDQTDPSAYYIWEDDGFYTVGAMIKDNDGSYTEYTTTVTVVNVDPTADVSDNGPIVEGEPITISFSDIYDPGIYDTFTYFFDWDFDGIYDIYGQENPAASYTWYDEGSYPVRIMIMDNSGGFTEYIIYSTVANVPPTIDSFSVTPFDPLAIGDPVTVSAIYSDPGDDTLTTTISWGDGSSTTTSGYAVEENHVYSTPGVYTITLTVSDGTETVEISYQYAVVYDPTGSFITGGGHFGSPAGAYKDDLTLTGKAGFGFVSKYQKGATTPGGNTQFRFHAGDLSFKSESYDWLVVAGHKGMFKGTGTINGDGNYKFIISAIDGDLTGGNGVDKFRIKIWEEDGAGNENVIYDNNLGSADDANPTTALTHGSIKIHKG